MPDRHVHLLRRSGCLSTLLYPAFAWLNCVSSQIHFWGECPLLQTPALLFEIVLTGISLVCNMSEPTGLIELYRGEDPVVESVSLRRAPMG